MVLNTSLLGIVYRACTSTPLYLTAHEIWNAKLHRFKNAIGAKFKKSRDPDHAH